MTRPTHWRGIPQNRAILNGETAMRAMVLDQQKSVTERPLFLRDVAVPVPGPGQVRVRVSYCGLCHTDLHTVEGDLPPHKLPLIPGHQIVGLVEETGAGVKGLKTGDRVGIPWLHSTDGTCAYCIRGLENLCQRAQFTGYDVNGGYAESTVVGAEYASKLPVGFSDEHAAPLLCAGIIGYRSYRLAAVPKQARLGLYGFGASAHIVLQLARHLGHEVYVFTRAEAHRELARRLGAAWVGDAKDAPPAKLDAAIIFAPAGALVLDALRAVRKAGSVVLAGIHMSPIPELDYRLLYDERMLRSVANSTRQDAREFLELAAEVPVQTETTVFPLEAANDALIALKQSKIEGAGVLRI